MKKKIPYSEKIKLLKKKHKRSLKRDIVYTFDCLDSYDGFEISEIQNELRKIKKKYEDCPYLKYLLGHSSHDYEECDFVVFGVRKETDNEWENRIKFYPLN